MPQFDIEGYVSKINETENIIKEELEKKGLPDDIQSYNSFVKKLLRNLGVEGSELTPQKFLSFHKYVLLNKELQQNESKKRLLLSEIERTRS
jgi:hypothetical protein